MDERKEQLKQKSMELKKQKEARKNRVHEFKNKYEEALFNIADPLLPVQGVPDGRPDVQMSRHSRSCVAHDFYGTK